MTELWAETPKKKWTVHSSKKTVPGGKFDFPKHIFNKKRLYNWLYFISTGYYEGGKSQTKEGKHIKWYYWAWKHRNMVLSKKIERRQKIKNNPLYTSKIKTAACVSSQTWWDQTHAGVFCFPRSELLA